MPEVFRLFGYSFFFYSREHEPLHIHVEGNGGMAKFDWDGSNFVVSERHDIKAGDYRKIKAAIDENAQLIIKFWKTQFGQNDDNENHGDMV